MVPWGWLIATFVVGGCFGFFIAALCYISKDNKED